MRELISVPLPLNISSREVGLYALYKSYKFPNQKVKLFKNVFITPSGFCINKNGLIKECHHDYPMQHENYLSEASQYYQDSVDNPGNLIILDNDVTYLTIHHPWFNYYHWICESIFRLWLVRKRADQLTLILPESYRNADFITGSLQPFALKNIYYVPNNKSLLVKSLCLPQIKPICDSYNSLHIKQVRHFYREYIISQKKPAGGKIDKLYVSRKLAGRRKIINEDEILDILSRHGFTIFYPEKYCFLEQLAIFIQVQYLVGEHGSGLTNMLFMGKGTSILELHKNKTNELNHPSFLFWYMAEALGINYYHQSCTTHGREDYFEGDYIVEPSLFEHNLRFMLLRDDS
jgi:capsular polysaccharide biosynthesis protein